MNLPVPHLPGAGCAVPGFLLMLIVGCATQPAVVRTVIEVPEPRLYTIEPPPGNTQYRLMSVVTNDVVTYRIGKEVHCLTNQYRSKLLIMRTFYRTNSGWVERPE
jgi:hypothetical protein